MRWHRRVARFANTKMQDYADRTGHPHRWPDVLDWWRYWDDVGVQIHDEAMVRPDAANLARLAHVTHPDLIAALRGALADVDLDRRTVEDDRVLANVLDAVITEQIRRTPRLGPSWYLTRLAKPHQFTRNAPYRGACDTRFVEMKAMLQGLWTRPVH